MAKIIILPDKSLREKSKNASLNQQTLKVINELKETLLGQKGEVKGIGLSAVQIGIPARIFLAYSKKSRKFLTFINPRILWLSKDLTDGIPESKNKYEGCLSVPGRWAIVKRSKEVKISYSNEKGTLVTRRFSGIIATVIQHEYDHLEGILFIDRALQQNSPIYQLEKDPDGKEYLKEINI